uniref:DNA-directed RNA polymerase n=1 Tax=Nephromyces sp. ex Molgula occidentalis TaxID=2544991 RepID=A0A5C1H7U5_9APIC|nr:plastid-encoded DNA-directed RNA polymerase beta''B [Nephromyces sp. ex Molgula occidentalis]
MFFFYNLVYIIFFFFKLYQLYFPLYIFYYLSSFGVSNWKKYSCQQQYNYSKFNIKQFLHTSNYKVSQVFDPYEILHTTNNSILYNKLWFIDKNKFKLLAVTDMKQHSNKLLKKPILIEKTSLHIGIHKDIITKNQYLFHSLTASSSPKYKQLLVQLHNLNSQKLTYSSCPSIVLPKTTSLLKELFSPLTGVKQAIDITYGLQHIETIFEAWRPKCNSFIITQGFLIDKISTQLYEDKSNLFVQKLLIFTQTNQSKLDFQYSSHIKSLLINKTSILSGGSLIQFINYSPHLILQYKYDNTLSYGTQFFASKSCFIFIQHLLLESLVKQYFIHGIIIPIIHFELIIKKMTACVKIIALGDTAFKYNDILPFNLIHMVNMALLYHGYTLSSYKPHLLGISKSILASSGFLTASSFQETLKTLIHSALETKVDWITDLKTRIMFADLITSGSGWYRFFNKL